jgi:Rrf2 family protein
MKISFKGDYALKIILDLAINHGQGITQIRDIAKRQDIPERFLEQIITLLKGAGFVKTVRGPKGGVLLAKDPSKITMGQIIRLIEGPTSPITCVSRTCHVKCSYETKCVLRDVFENVREKINDVVDNTTFKDLVEAENKNRNLAPNDYSI